MSSNSRDFSPRRAAVAALDFGDQRRGKYLWFAAFLLLTGALAGLEIRSEALTVGALPRAADATGAAEQTLVIPVVATAVAVVGADRD